MVRARYLRSADPENDAQVIELIAERMNLARMIEEDLKADSTSVSPTDAGPRGTSVPCRQNKTVHHAEVEDAHSDHVFERHSYNFRPNIEVEINEGS